MFCTVPYFFYSKNVRQQAYQQVLGYVSILNNLSLNNILHPSISVGFTRSTARKKFLQ